MTNPLKSKTKFTKLKDKWYAKLKKSGFEDIERNEYDLFSSSDRFLDKRRIQRQEHAEMYFNLCLQFLNEYKFETKREAIIWEYHANGLTVRDIAVTLRKAKILMDEDKDSVHKIVKKLRKLMKDRYFQRKIDE